MTFVRYKMRWPEPIVPDGEPTWFYYEVDANRDNVVRMIECWESGISKRNTLVREHENRAQCNSLIEAPFSDCIAEHPFELISREEFDGVFSQASD